MKKILYIALILLCFINEAYSQKKYNKCCDANIFLDIEYADSVPLYKGDSGRVIAFLKHDLDDENFIQFKILNKSEEMFYVHVYKSQNENKILLKGWIKKEKHLGIYSRAYNKNLILYKNPEDNSEIVCQEEYESKMYEVIDCQGDWLKIKTVIDGKIYEGWIPPESQCANVYSTCS